LKLLFILPEYLPHSGGGIITFYRALLPQLVAMGHEVRVIVGSAMFAQEKPDSVIIDGVNIESLEQGLREKYYEQFQSYASTPWLRKHLAAAWALYEQAGKGEAYDVVEASDWGLLFVPWALEQTAPLLVRMHGSLGQIDIHDPVAGEDVQGQLARLIERQALCFANTVQTYSPANAAFWEAQTGREVNCLYPAWQAFANVADNITKTDRGIVLGRLQRWKGPQILCEALQKLGAQAPIVEWMGRDSIYDNRQRTMAQYLAEKFPAVWHQRFLHSPPQAPEVAAARQSAAAFAIVPSTWDVFNFTCVEAMGQGIPVICSTGAGASSLIDDGVNGFVFQNENSQALAEAISRCTAMTGAQRMAMADAARSTVSKELNPQQVAEKYLHAYEATVKKPRQAIAQDNWLRRACAPTEKQVEPLSFLDNLPLKELMHYVWQRGKKKISP
jgi:glycosyltransferase involved in cell wall biosynthesis